MNTRNGRYLVRICALMAVLFFLAACPVPTPTPISDADRVATRVAEDRAVAATLTALAPAPMAAPATLTPLPTLPPTPSPQPSPTRLTVTVIALTPTRLTVTVLPILRTPTPTGPGITATPTQPSVSLAPAPSRTPTRLLITVVPMPTLPPLSPTPIPVAVVPVDGEAGNPNLRNGRIVNGGRNILLPGLSQAEVKSPLVFRDRLVFQVEVFDASVGQKDGDGIQSVMFLIVDPTGRLVHSYEDTTARYCAFGGEPECTVWRFSAQGNRWPEGAALNYGEHNVEIVVKPKKGQPASWFWGFRIEKP